jgi:hypothetical protein
MEITEIKGRIAEIGERLAEINREQTTSGWELARSQGTSEQKGVSIDPLTAWAWRMRELNTEAKELVEERRQLRELKRTEPCSCSCCEH